MAASLPLILFIFKESGDHQAKGWVAGPGVDEGNHVRKGHVPCLAGLDSALGHKASKQGVAVYLPAAASPAFNPLTSITLAKISFASGRV